MHKHQCEKCGYVWEHPERSSNRAHLCAQCGEEQRLHHIITGWMTDDMAFSIRSLWRAHGRPSRGEVRIGPAETVKFYKRDCEIYAEVVGEPGYVLLDCWLP